MSVGEVFDAGIRVAFALGIPGAVVWYVRDRRKDRAATEVAEQTVPADVALKTLAADDARLGYIDRAMDSERRSYVAAIGERDREIARQRQELRHRDEIIHGLREQVTALEAKLAEVTRQLSAVREQLNELAEEANGTGDPA